MKKTIAALFSLFICINSSFALTYTEVPNRIPDELYISEHWLSLTTSYDIETKTQKLGTLYRRFFSLLLTYDFYDPFDNRIAYARSKFFSLTAHFDVYDNQENFLGSADERLFAFFPTFDIYARDGYSKLATASMNFWGTRFTMYDPVTNNEMAIMSRSFFRLKNNWTFKVTNRALFDHKGIDPRVLMTVTAFQGDREYWEQERHDDLKTLVKSTGATSAADVTPAHLNTLLEQIATVSKQAGFDEGDIPDDATVEAIATELENGYKNSQIADSSMQTDKDRMNSFADYCLNLAQSNTVSDEKRKSILYLLKTRLEVTSAQ